MAMLASCSGGRDIQTNLEQGAAFGSVRMVSNAGDIAEEVRGVWIASVYNINFPSAPDLTADKLKAEMDSIIDNTLSLGMNTVFFQVHPAADAVGGRGVPVRKPVRRDDRVHPAELPPQQQRRVVARVRVGEAPARRVEHAVDRRDELRVRGRLPEPVVLLADDLRPCVAEVNQTIG